MKTPINKQSRGFLEENCRVAAASIRRRFHQLSPLRRRQVFQLALRVLGNSALKRNATLRDGAAGLVVALLPNSISIVRKLLRDRSSALWYEVQFTIFCTLDAYDLKPKDRAPVLRLLYEYLLTINSDAGSAAWKAGDTLGDEWRSPETVKMLSDLLFSARFVAGRKAALHGIEHVLSKTTTEEAKELWAHVQRVAHQDRSAKVRRDAELTLKGVRCGIANSSS